MEEEEARAWVAQQFAVPRETLDRLDRFVVYLRHSNEGQNLVSSGSLDTVWNRHIADSAQLLRFSESDADWIDLGAGAGFPGLIIALLSCRTVTLVEARRLRSDFLQGAVDVLGIGDRCEIVSQRVETMPSRPFSVISARAFAPLDRLLTVAERFAGPQTIWILPKGRTAQTELEAVQASWQGDFRLEPSVTDPNARIIVAQGVRRRRREKYRG